MTLKEIVKWFLNNYEAGHYISVSLATAVNMVKIITGNTGGFVIFDNGPSRQLTIWSGEEVVHRIVHGRISRIYAHRLAGKETIIMVPVSIDRGFIYWKRG